MGVNMAGTASAMMHSARKLPARRLIPPYFKRTERTSDPDAIQEEEVYKIEADHEDQAGVTATDRKVVPAKDVSEN